MMTKSRKDSKTVSLGLLAFADILSITLGGMARAQTGLANPILPTENGPVRCSAGVGVLACLGIPYAAPPVGDLRLRPPTTAPKWSVVRDATRFGSPCIQDKTEYEPSRFGSEDCLYLNVYKPSNVTDLAPLPVMVWLHGGGFVNGSGNAFNGAFLAQDAHVVVVTVNYRLGPFGWLALPSLAAETKDGTTGNYGLLDDIAALTWVQHNIAGFGGDVKRVTLAGQSAGGEQVLALVASSYAAGLFQRAISMSAPATLRMPTVKSIYPKRVSFLAEVGCAVTATQAACLRRVDPQTMLTAGHESWNLINNGGLSWTETIDGAVLRDQWNTVFRSGNFNRVPILIGHTADEAKLFLAIFDNAQGHLATEDEVAERTRFLFRTAAPLVMHQYSFSAYGSADRQFNAMIVDAQFVIGQNQDRLALSSYVPVYGYQACDPHAPESHVHALFLPIGCGHDSDLGSLFDWDDFSGVQPTLTAEQRLLSTQTQHYFGNFAASGDPNGPSLPLWPLDVKGANQVQLLEPASMGGIRSTKPRDYASQHNLGFWSIIVWMGGSPHLLLISIAFGVLLLFSPLVLLFRKTVQKRSQSQGPRQS